MTKETLIRDLRKRIERVGTAYKLAIQLGVPPSHMSDVVNGRREPGKKLLGALGLVEVRTYEKARA